MKDVCVTIFDSHSPFFHVKFINNICKCISDIKPKQIVLGGDISDFFGGSKFATESHRAETFQYEQSCTLQLLDQIRNASKDAEIIYVIGNHEERLEKYKNTNAKYFRGLDCLEIHELFNFERFNIQRVDHVYFLNKNFIITHGTACSRFPARTEILNFDGYSGCSGHVHRYDFARVDQIDGSYREWHSFGHSSDESLLKYAAKFKHKWNKSFGIIEYDKKDFLVTPVFAKENGSFYCSFNKKKYQ